MTGPGQPRTCSHPLTFEVGHVGAKNIAYFYDLYYGNGIFSPY